MGVALARGEAIEHAKEKAQSTQVPPYPFLLDETSTSPEPVKIGVRVV